MKKCVGCLAIFTYLLTMVVSVRMNHVAHCCLWYSFHPCNILLCRTHDLANPNWNLVEPEGTLNRFDRKFVVVRNIPGELYMMDMRTWEDEEDNDWK